MHKKYLRLRNVFSMALTASLLSGCGSVPTFVEDSDSAPERIDFDRLEKVGNAVPRHEPPSRYGNPGSYEQNGETYHVLASSKGYVRRGQASWYGTKFHGKRTSSGERYDMFAMTAAHKTLPLPTYARVTNLNNGRSVIVKVNDRGPFVDGRIIDLSYAAAYKLGIIKNGTGFVEVSAIDPREPQDIPQGQVIAAAPLETPASAEPVPVDFTPIEPVAAVERPEKSKALQMFLQVGAFSSRQNAELLLKRLAGSAFNNISITQAQGNRYNVYRVRIGPLPNEQVADRIAEKLLSIGLGRGHVVLD